MKVFHTELEKFIDIDGSNGLVDFLIEKEDVKPNYLFQHKKGNFYKVIGVYSLKEIEEEVVLYIPVYDDSRIFIRPYSQFVSVDNGIKRFKFIVDLGLIINSREIYNLEYLDYHPFLGISQIFDKETTFLSSDKKENMVMVTRKRKLNYLSNSFFKNYVSEHKEKIDITDETLINKNNLICIITSSQREELATLLIEEDCYSCEDIMNLLKVNSWLSDLYNNLMNNSNYLEDDYDFKNFLEDYILDNFDYSDKEFKNHIAIFKGKVKNVDEDIFTVTIKSNNYKVVDFNTLFVK